MTSRDATFILCVDQHLLDSNGNLGTVDFVVAEYADHALAALGVGALLSQVLGAVHDLDVAPVRTSAVFAVAEQWLESRQTSNAHRLNISPHGHSVG